MSPLAYTVFVRNPSCYVYLNFVVFSTSALLFNKYLFCSTILCSFLMKVKCVTIMLQAFCRQCAVFICKECVKQHETMKTFGSHKVVLFLWMILGKFKTMLVFHKQLKKIRTTMEKIESQGESMVNIIQTSYIQQRQELYTRTNSH